MSNSDIQTDSNVCRNVIFSIEKITFEEYCGYLLQTQKAAIDLAVCTPVNSDAATPPVSVSVKSKVLSAHTT